MSDGPRQPEVALDTRPTLVVAGASGFIGRALGERLAGRFHLVGLTRSPGRQPSDSPYTWRRCDLFSRLEAHEALADADYAIYLVHSMMPSAALTQGDFRDLDLICADNFARAAEDAGCEQIVYLSGLIPDERPLSEHLASRLEVERTLGSYTPSLTALRAGLVIGPGGSSTEIMVNLVRRLPVLVCPRWTRSETQPIALRDVVKLLDFAVGRAELYDDHFDIGGPNVMTYRGMMERTAELLGLRRLFLGVPWLSPRLSRLWVSVISGQPRELVTPLVESLRHPMVAGEQRIQEMAGIEGQSFDEAMREAIGEDASRKALPVAPAQPDAHGRMTSSPTSASGEAVRAAETHITPRPTGPERDHDALVAEAVRGGMATGGGTSGEIRRVRSVQRLALPRGRDARWIAEEYARWLPRFMRPIIGVQVQADRTVRFYLRPIPWPLLVMDFDEDVSGSDRHLYWITGGLLASRSERGRLEFREVLGGRCALAAIHEFSPRLPWYVYVWTQARVHLWVMRGFQRHLARLSRSSAETVQEPRALPAGGE